MTKRDWKAITIDFGAMADYDSVTPVALCLTQQQVAILKACLIPQYWPTRWTNLTLDAQELNEFISEIDYALVLECGDVDCVDVVDCMDADADYIALTGYQLDFLVAASQERDEGLDDDYDGTAQSIGADIPVGVPDTEEAHAMCYAVEKFVKFWAVSTRAQISRASGWRVFLDEITTAAVDFYNWFAPYVAPGYIADIFGCFVGFAEAFEALDDDEALDLLACCLVDNLDGVAMTEANFNTAISDCASSLSGVAGDIACVFDGANNTEIYLVFLSGYQIAIERQDAAENLPCGCTAWCYWFDFTAGAESWTNRASDSRPFGVWVDTVGWTSVWGTVGSDSDERLYIERDFTAQYVTQVKMTFNLDGTGGSSRHWILQAKLGGSLKAQMSYAAENLPMDGTPITAVLNVYQPIDEIEQSLVGDANEGNIDFTITECIVRGNGTNPFGTDNCV